VVEADDADGVVARCQPSPAAEPGAVGESEPVPPAVDPFVEPPRGRAAIRLAGVVLQGEHGPLGSRDALGQWFEEDTRVRRVVPNGPFEAGQVRRRRPGVGRRILRSGVVRLPDGHAERGRPGVRGRERPLRERSADVVELIPPDCERSPSSRVPDECVLAGPSLLRGESDRPRHEVVGGRVEDPESSVGLLDGRDGVDELVRFGRDEQQARVGADGCSSAPDHRQVRHPERQRRLRLVAEGGSDRRRTLGVGWCGEHGTH